MKKTIYLHIGIGKTGTSAIQKTLFEQREKLIQNDIYLPLVGLARNNIGHHNLANFNEVHPSVETISLYSRLLKELDSIKQNTILLSSENYCYCKQDFINFIKEKLCDYDLKIIFFVREQIKLIESTYLLWQAQGYDYRNNIHDFFKMADGGFNYNWMINRWTRVLCDSAINVRIYDKKMFRDGIIKYFLEVIDTSLTLKEEKEIINKSLLPYYSPIISYIDRHFPSLLSEENHSQLIRKKIIELLISISTKDVLKVELLEKLSIIKSLLMDTIDDYLEEEEDFEMFLRNYLIDMNLEKSLIDISLREEILNYYKVSNYEFSNRFLQNDEKKVFLKNYI